MEGILRRLRGAVGTALTWAVAWAIVAAGVLGVVYLLDPDFRSVAFWQELFWEVAGPVIAVVAGSGLVAGTIFSVVLGTVYRNRRIGDLSPGRMALWGAGAALLLPAGLLGLGVAAGMPAGADLVGITLGSVIVLGAGTAGGTIKLAQAAGDAELESAVRDKLPGSGA